MAPPPRILPLLYFAAAHVALIAAFGIVAVDPAGFTGFFYQPRMLAVVHLVTLGWLTSSILGAIYIVGPMGLRMPMRAGWRDYAAFACVIIGIAGMITHFWIERPSGMAWSALMVVLGASAVGLEVTVQLPRARIPRSVKAHIVLAFGNLVAAGAFGVVLGFNKARPFLPGRPLEYAYAHAHLAAVGWVTMMIVGVGYRLMPMLLPAAMPEGRGLWTSAVLLEIGAAGLFVSLAAGWGSPVPWAVAAIAGIVAFVVVVIGMLRDRRPAPPAARRPDFGILHVAQGLVYFALAAGLGLVLAIAPASERTLRLIPVYGILGLIGCLGQIVVGVGSRLIPMFAALQALVLTHGSDTVPLPQAMPLRPLQAATFALWTAGVPVLAGGAYVESALWVGLGALMLTTAAIVVFLTTLDVARHALQRAPGEASSTGGHP